MKESDHQVLCTFTRSLVNQLDTCCLALCESFCYVLYVESDMVYSTATAILFNKLSDSGLRACRLEKLDFYFAYFKESSTNLLVLNYFNRITLVPGKELKERSCLFNRSYSNT